MGKTFLGVGSDIQQDRPFKYNVCSLMEKNLTRDGKWVIAGEPVLISR